MPSPEALLTLIRHGQTQDNADGRWHGRGDGSLTLEGRKQVEALAQRLKARGRFSAFYASSFVRAVETAELLAPLLGNSTITIDARPREYDFGAWDGLTPSELRARGFWEAVQRDPEFTPPHGEASGAAARRVAAALQEFAVAHRGARVPVVGPVSHSPQRSLY